MKKALLIALVLLLALIGVYLVRSIKPEYRTDVAELGQSPDWQELAEMPAHVTAEEFSALLRRYYVVGDTWQEHFSFPAPQELVITTADGDLTHSLDTPRRKQKGRYWRSKDELPGRSVERPLDGIKIALDPGHIGGKCAKLEERWFQIGDNLPVMEGEMTLLVAQLIKPRLEALGADVDLTRSANAPVGRKRSPHFRALAKAKVETLERDPKMVGRYADKFFYRTAEIRARARAVNDDIQPDLVVALHFNAEAWGDPADPQLTSNNHFHILLNGAYTASELAHEDERFELSRRIQQGVIREEIALSESFVQGFKQHTQLPPYQYEPNSQRAIKVDQEGYVWTRNLLANRLFQCPTIFLEPYIMNSAQVHDRIQRGDYEGVQEVDGELRKSIFREYAEAVVDSLVRYYRD